MIGSFRSVVSFLYPFGPPRRRELIAPGLLLGRRLAPATLALGGAPLLLEPPPARGPGRAGRAAAGRDPQRRRQLRRQPFQRQLAIAGLAASVLGDGGDGWTGALQQAGAARLVEDAGG